MRQVRAEDHLCDRIARQHGLPLRPLTARWRLESQGEFQQRLSPGATASARNDLEPIDPGWMLRQSIGAEPSDLAFIASRSWWPAVSPAASEAIDQLWKYAVATSLAARKLAVLQGDPDPDALVRAGLLHPLGLWGLAAVDPERLAQWLTTKAVETRRRLERTWFRRGLTMFSRSLAERWGCEAIVRDATWLLDDDQRQLDSCTNHPDRLALVRQARDWANQTPWALEARTPSTTNAPDPWSKWLRAEVQTRCSGGLRHVPGTPEEERLTQAHARLLLESRQLRATLDTQSHFLMAVASGDPASKHTRRSPEPEGDNLDASPESAQRAWNAWADLVSNRDRLARDLEVALAALGSDHEECNALDRRDALDALAEFAAGAAHELNNPLAVMMGRAQLLRAKLDAPDQVRSLDTIVQQAQRAHRILRDLMYVARPSAPRPRACLPDEILRGCLADLKTEASSRRVTLQSRTRTPGPVAWADPDALRHAAEVLLRNSLEATPEDGTIRAESTGTSQMLIWTIQDDGPGLSAIEAQHLLDPFYCGRNAGRGLGLGLPRLARFLHQVGGTLRWRSQFAHGCIFRMTLPLIPPPDPAAGIPDDGRSKLGPRLRKPQAMPISGNIESATV